MGASYDVEPTPSAADNVDGVDDSKEDVHQIAVAEVDDELRHDALRVIEVPKNKWVRRYRSVAFQMVILSILSFSGPSMSNAISGLGGGGLASPYTSNIASSTQYAVSAFVAMIGGPIISTIGIPIACCIGALGFPLSGSGFYVNSKYGIQWYLIFAKALYGFTSAFLYVSEATAMISYPEEHRRGLYVSIWVCMRNVGSIIGGAITLGLNIASNGAGGVSVNTYLAFLGLECVGLPAALLLTRSSRVVRSDGYGVPMVPKQSWKREMKLLWEHHKQKRTLLLVPIYFYSYFGDGVWGTYLSLHFSVRARALSAFLCPVAACIFNPLFGMLLDGKVLGPKRKGNVAFWIYTIPTLGMLIWVMINLHWFFQRPSTLRLDYTADRWAVSWLPYFIYQVNAWMSQTLVYWILGQFASDVQTNARTGGVFRGWETVGQAVSYGINSHTANKWIPFSIYFAVFCVSIPPLWFVVQELPDESKELKAVTEDGQIQDIQLRPANQVVEASV